MAHASRGRSGSGHSGAPLPGRPSPSEGRRTHPILLLRWLTIIATAYAVLFSDGAVPEPFVRLILLLFVLSNASLLAFGRQGYEAPRVIDLNETIVAMHRMLRRITPHATSDHW